MHHAQQAAEATGRRLVISKRHVLGRLQVNFEGCNPYSTGLSLAGGMPGMYACVGWGTSERKFSA